MAPKIEDLSGKTIGNWKVLHLDLQPQKSTRKYRRYICECICGKKSSVIAYSVKRTNGCKSCGQNRRYIPGTKIGVFTYVKPIFGTSNHEAICKCGGIYVGSISTMKRLKIGCRNCVSLAHIERAKSVVGEMIGRMIVHKFLGMKGHPASRAFYELKCQCGKKVVKSIACLRNSQSCGCLREINRPKGSRFNRSALNETDVGALRNLHKSKIYTDEELAEMFNIATKHLKVILSGRTWKHVK